MLAVLVGQLHVRNVAAHDLHAVSGQLTVQQFLHVLHVRAAQVIGAFGADLPAALTDRVLHGVGQHEVEVARADGLHEANCVHDPEAQEELDRLQRHVLVRRAGQHGGGIRDFGGHVDHVGHPRPGVPQVVPTGGQTEPADGPELGEHADGAFLDLDDRRPPPPQRGQGDQDYGRQPGQDCDAAEPIDA